MSKVYEIVTDKIIQSIEKGGIAPWRQPWTGGVASLGSNRSMVTGRRYRGANAFLTAAQGFNSPLWLTLKQANTLGGSIKKGERGTPIIFLGQGTKTDEAGDESKFSFLRFYTVFNLEQTSGIASPEPAPVVTGEFTPIEACARIVDTQPMRLRILHEKQRAYYSPTLDYINMPKPESFTKAEEYYGTLFHELGHATGHASRLNRESLQKIAGFGSHEYSKEELVAEMTAAFVCAEAGISPVTLENSASYLAGWLKVLRADPKMLVSAAAQAQKAADLILNRKDP